MAWMTKCKQLTLQSLLCLILIKDFAFREDECQLSSIFTNTSQFSLDWLTCFILNFLYTVYLKANWLWSDILSSCVKMGSDSFSAISFNCENDFDLNVTLLCGFDFLGYFKLQLQKKMKQNTKLSQIT